MSEDFKKRCIPFTDAQWTRFEEERARHGSKSFDPCLEPERERVDALYVERLKASLTKLERLRQGDYKEAEEICKKVARGE